ncbi:hypothetical protein K438DRAFT_1957289 [Mycena galopus ATCC 62051]|nr:hypothetical protein K438DRAFT_1957289 [Mycena galopus ATCC 62051]
MNRDPPSPALSDEMLLEIFEHLDTKELLSLAAVSTHIHDVSLIMLLARHGITGPDIRAHSFDTTSGALPALCVARFITRIDALRVRFEANAEFEREVNALATLGRRLLIKSIDVKISPFPGLVNMEERFKLFALISPHRSHSHRDRHVAASSSSAPALIVYPSETACPASVSICTFESLAVTGILVVRCSATTDSLYLAPHRLSSAEINFLLSHLYLPALRIISGCFGIPTELSSFLRRHSTLQRLRLHCFRPKESLTAPPLIPLPADALPHLESVQAAARFIIWLLGAPSSFPHLDSATIELY